MSSIATVRGRRPAPKVTPKKPINKEAEIQKKGEINNDVDIDNRENETHYNVIRLEKKQSFQERLESGEVIKVGNYKCSIDGLYHKITDKKSGEVKEVKLSDGVYINDRVYNIDTKEVYISVLHKFGGKFNTLKCSMNVILPNELAKKVNNGFDIPYQNRYSISEFLNAQGKEVPHINSYKNGGWHKSINSDDEFIFRHDKTITSDEEEMAICDVELSEYDLRKKGSLRVWRNMFWKHIKGNTQLEALICIASSAILVGYSARVFGEMESLIIHIYGNSTQGKTTGVMVGVSLIGNPSSKNKGLSRSWNGTSNAIINFLSGNYGIPVIFDELSMNREKDSTSTVYALSAGKDKARLNDSITQREQGEWATTILSTGEQSILERTNKNAGLSIRAIEFSNVQWTKSAENAEEIKNIILNNYGGGAEPIVRRINNLGENGVQALTNRWKNRLKEELSESKFKDRIANKLAIILATGEIINNAIEINLDLDNILNFLVENEEKTMLERDIGAKAFNQIIQKVIENKSNFKVNNMALQNNICWGSINFNQDYYEVAILKNVLEKNLRDLGYGEPKVIIKEWKNSNYLQCEPDRSTKRIRLFSIEESELRKNSLEKEYIPNKLDDTTYVLKVPKEYLQGFLMDN